MQKVTWVGPTVWQLTGTCHMLPVSGVVARPICTYKHLGLDGSNLDLVRSLAGGPDRMGARTQRER